MIPLEFNYLDLHTHSIYQREGVITIKNQILGLDPPVTQFFSAGIHPWYTHLATTNDLFKEMTSSRLCLFVGECGLDKLQGNTLEIQLEYFKKQVQWSETIQKPLIIHCVKAHQEILEFKKKRVPQMPWIFHGFNKKKQLAAEFIKAGFYLSFGADIITKPTVKETFRSTPIQQLFLETDDQDQYSIEQIYEAASNIKNISLQELQDGIKENFKIVLQKCKI